MAEQVRFFRASRAAIARAKDRELKRRHPLRVYVAPMTAFSKRALMTAGFDVSPWESIVTGIR